MSEIITIIIVILVTILVFMSYVTGVETGRNDLCKEMKAEYYRNKCVIVERKELELIPSTEHKK